VWGAVSISTSRSLIEKKPSAAHSILSVTAKPPFEKLAPAEAGAEFGG
jgi:hypothetical protein